MPSRQANVEQAEGEIDPKHATVGTTEGGAEGDPGGAPAAWTKATWGVESTGRQGVGYSRNRRGAPVGPMPCKRGSGVHIVGVKGQEVMVKVPRECYRNLIGARKPTGAVYKKTIQPTATTKDLEGAVAELQHMEQMERAAAEISNSKIDTKQVFDRKKCQDGQ